MEPVVGLVESEPSGHDVCMVPAEMELDVGFVESEPSGHVAPGEASQQEHNFFTTIYKTLLRSIRRATT